MTQNKKVIRNQYEQLYSKLENVDKMKKYLEKNAEGYQKHKR